MPTLTAIAVVVVLVAAACTPPGGGSPSPPSTQRFCELWDDVEEVTADSPRIADPVLVDDNVVAEAEAAQTLGSDCTAPGAQVALDEAMLAEGAAIPAAETDSSLRSSGDAGALEGEEAGEDEEIVVATGDRLEAQEPVLDNVTIKSFSVWISWNGIEVRGVADVRLSGVTSSIGFSGTLTDLDNWTLSLSSSAFTVPDITTSPATFSGTLRMVGGVPSLTLSAAVATVEIDDVTVRGASFDLMASPDGVTASIAGAVEFGSNSVQGTVAVELDGSGSIVAVQAEVDGEFSGRGPDGEIVELVGDVSMDGNGEETVVTFKGSGAVGPLVVNNAAGSLTFVGDRTTFDGIVDVETPDASARFNGQIIFDGDDVILPLFEIEVEGQYSGELDSGELVRVDGTLHSEIGYGGQMITTVEGSFEVGTLQAIGSAVVETEFDRVALQVDAVIGYDDGFGNGLHGARLTGYIELDGGYVERIELAADVQRIQIGSLELTDVALWMRAVEGHATDVTVAGNLAVGDMVEGYVEADLRFGPDGQLMSITSGRRSEVSVDLDGFVLEASAGISATPANVELTDIRAEMQYEDIFRASDIEGYFRVGSEADAGWEFVGTLDPALPVVGEMKAGRVHLSSERANVIVGSGSAKVALTRHHFHVRMYLQPSSLCRWMFITGSAAIRAPILSEIIKDGLQSAVPAGCDVVMNASEDFPDEAFEPPYYSYGPR